MRYDYRMEMGPGGGGGGWSLRWFLGTYTDPGSHLLLHTQQQDLSNIDYSVVGNGCSFVNFVCILLSILRC